VTVTDITDDGGGLLQVLGLLLFLIPSVAAATICGNIPRFVETDGPLQLVGQPGEIIHLELFKGESYSGSWSSSDGFYFEARDAAAEFTTVIKVLPPTKVESQSVESNKFFTVRGSLRVPEVPGEGVYSLSGALRGDLNFPFTPANGEPGGRRQVLIDVPVELKILPPGDFNTTAKERRRKLQWLWGIYFAYLAVFVTSVIFSIKLFNSRSREDKPLIAFT